MLASSLVPDLRALPERSLILELARTEDALRPVPSPGPATEVKTQAQSRFAIISYQQRIIAELRRRRQRLTSGAARIG